MKQPILRTMKILILGITGRTGSLVAEEAIKRGHKVVGIAHDPGRITLKEAKLFKEHHVILIL